MDHPKNLRFPTAWHVRDYGLFAANLFYDKKPEWPDQGPIFLSKARDDKLDLSYRIYIHKGDEKVGKVEDMWRMWASSPRIDF
ncbi:PmoA family protein [Candidatus Bathyarchaeota archaeon]|nr:PmoA family protein [Candidatus Bathyarchaeota archaeon]